MGLFAPGLALAAATTAQPLSGARAAAVSALVNLGYSQTDAARVVAQATRDVGDDATESTLIRAALKALAPTA
jgi:Holliday junction DNA helicase RuvA